MARVCAVAIAVLLASFGCVQSVRPLVDSCGKVQLNSTGFPTSDGSGVHGAGAWPWMVRIGQQINGEQQWPCGGTLISERTVLTAAHCVKNPSDLTARLGEHDTTTTNDGEHTDVSVASVIIHPGYIKFQNDIALLQLSQPVTFSQRIQPACLPAPDADHTGQRVTVIGWGADRFFGDPSPVLRAITLSVTDEQECEQIYEKTGSFNFKFPGGFQGTKLCTTNADGTSRDACHGDGGGPLVYHDAAENRYQVIGVVSTGRGCGGPSFPGIYTKVSKYTSWISSHK